MPFGYCALRGLIQVMVCAASAPGAGVIARTEPDMGTGPYRASYYYYQGKRVRLVVDGDGNPVPKRDA